MDEPITRYAVLRDGRTWAGVMATQLQAQPDGVLTLARVPGPVDGQAITLADPYETDASGLAIGDCNDHYLADTAGHRLVWIDGVCGARMLVPGNAWPGDAPGRFDEPRGLLLGPPGSLYVADSANGRIQVLRLPGLEVRAIWEEPFQRPTGLACDSQNRIYVLDRGLKQVLRFDAWGLADGTYNTAMATQLSLASPAFMAIDAGDTLYLADDVANVVLRFDPAGQPLEPLPSAGGAAPARPRALAAQENRLYVADGAAGYIWVFDRLAGQYLGTVSGYCGPVTALALDEVGTLYIKSGLDETIYPLAAESAFISSGQLVSERLDAGEQSEWVRVAVAADVPAGTQLRLELFASDDPLATPAETDWLETAALDTLLPSFSGPGNGQPHLRRYLWLRLWLTSRNWQASPQLRQVQAETAGENYLDYLPAIYQRDAADGFLARWLALFRSQLGDLERTLEAMPRRFDPATTPEDHLVWLARWLAFDVPPGQDVAGLRALLLQVHQLYRRRGTLAGLREFIQLYTGVRPQIIESFQGRRLWLLGHTSTLGFDTGLAPLDPQGLVVPDPSPPTCSLDSAAAPATAAWTEPAGLVVGEVVVGQSVPLAAADLGEPLFSETAYHFTVLVSATQASEPDQRQALQEIIEAEKPAHTDYHLCFIEARMRVGFQARLGIDAIIAGPPKPLALDEAILGLDTTLGEEPGETGFSRVGQRARLGRNLVVQ
jgi:phage tail-like protein